MKRPLEMLGLKSAEVDIDAQMFKILWDMYDGDATIINARTSILARVLHKPFSFEIPALGLKADENMENLIKEHYMPWLADCADWYNILHVIPYFFDHVHGIPIPRTPEKKAGRIVRLNQEKRRPKFRWYWNGDQQSHDSRMRWYIGPRCPDMEGVIRTGLVSLVPLYRLCTRLLEASTNVVVQRSRPTHLLERRPPANARNLDDRLSNLTAEFGARAVGATRTRQEEARAADERLKQKRIQSSIIQQQEKQTFGMATLQPVFDSDTFTTLFNETDSGFATRMFTLPEDCTYREPGKPDVPLSYLDIKRKFDSQVSALMNYPLELIEPSAGIGKAAALGGAETFVNDRIRDMATLFANIAHQAITDAYRPQFEKLFEGKDMHPKFDVHISMAVTSNIPDDTLLLLHEKGLMSQETLGKYMFRNHNIPLEDMTITKIENTK